MEAIDRSAAIRALQAVADGRESAEPGVLLRQIDYWLQPEEKQARVYARYVAVRSSNRAMNTELTDAIAAAPLATYRNVQWTARDGATIAGAIGEAFRELGWR